MALLRFTLGHSYEPSTSRAVDISDIFLSSYDKYGFGQSNGRMLFSNLTTGQNLALSYQGSPLGPASAGYLVDFMDTRGAVSFSGGNLGDFLRGGAGADALNGLGGNDTLYGGGGNDMLKGGAGDDRFYGGTGSNTYYGESGYDTVVYSNVTGSLTINLSTVGPQDTGAAGIEKYYMVENIVAGKGDDTLIGSSARNTFVGGLGADYIDGGAGLDTVDYSDAASRITVNTSISGRQNTGGGGFDSLISIESITGSRWNDVITNIGGYITHGGSGNDTIVAAATRGISYVYGDSGDDTISGTSAGGSLWIYGGDGDDTILAGPNHRAYRVYGGAGIDTLSYSDVTTDLVVNLTMAERVPWFRLVYGFEAVISGSGNDTLTAQIAYGGAGDDLVRGTEGDDKLFGGDGADKLTGSGGRDSLTGDAGADTFIFRSVSASPFGATRDIINDFEVGIDRINLRDIDANTKIDGDQAFTLIPGKSFTGKAGELYTARSGGNTYVNADIDGDGIGDFQLMLRGNLALSAKDFAL